MTVQLVKEFIRFCACELIMRGITALEVEGPDVLLATRDTFLKYVGGDYWMKNLIKEAQRGIMVRNSWLK